MIKDQYGTEIRPGTVITYPVRYGSNIYVNTMIVTEIKKEDPSNIILLGLIQIKQYNNGDYIKKIKKNRFFSPGRSTVVKPEIIKNIYNLIYEESLKY